MKKLFVAMLAVCAMAVSFTSCERKADPAKEPIAGKTYEYAVIGEESGFVRFTFHTNYKVTNVVNDAGSEVVQDALVWEMKSNAKDFDIKWAAGAINTQTGQPVGGMIVWKGTYDAETKTITVVLQGTQDIIQYICHEVK